MLPKSPHSTAKPGWVSATACPWDLHLQPGDRSPSQGGHWADSWAMDCGGSHLGTTPLWWSWQTKLFISLWWRFSSQEVRLASDLRLPRQLSLVILHMLAWHFFLANLILKTFVSFTLKWKVNLWLESSPALLWLPMPRLSLLPSLGSPFGFQSLPLPQWSH